MLGCDFLTNALTESNAATIPNVMDLTPIKKLLDQTRRELADLDKQRERLLVLAEAYTQSMEAMSAPARGLAAVEIAAPAEGPTFQLAPNTGQTMKIVPSGRQWPEKGSALSERWSGILAKLDALNRPFTYPDMLQAGSPELTYTLARTKVFDFKKSGLVETVGDGSYRLTQKGVDLYGNPNKPLAPAPTQGGLDV